MKKRSIAIVLFICLTVLYGVRVYFVNCNLALPVKQIYQKGEIVPFENDFRLSEEFACPGYTIQVLDATILTLDEFCQQYAIDKEIIDDGIKEYYYVVKISCGNENSTLSDNMGISLPMIELAGLNYYVMLDDRAFMLANPDMPGSSFSLQPNTTKEMVVTYPINVKNIGGYDNLIKHTPYLILTEYPTQKSIKIL